MFVLKVAKADRRALAEADLLGLKRSKNCVELLTSDESSGESDYDDDDDVGDSGCEDAAATSDAKKPTDKCRRYVVHV